MRAYPSARTDVSMQPPHRASKSERLMVDSSKLKAVLLGSLVKQSLDDLHMPPPARPHQRAAMLSIWFVHIASLPDVILHLPSEVRAEGKYGLPARAIKRLGRPIGRHVKRHRQISALDIEDQETQVHAMCSITIRYFVL